MGEARETMKETSEAEWIERARAGDAEAVEALISLHQSRIYGFGKKMCRDAEDARDVLQETLLAMAKGIGEFREDSSLSTWLYTVARSHCIKKRRRGRFEPEQVGALHLEEAASQLADEGALPDELLANKRLDAEIEDAIAALDPSYREVLVLRDVDGLSGAEVAEILGISVQAVKSRLHRARLSVRERVAPSFEGAMKSRERAPTCPDVLMLFSQYVEGDINGQTCATMEQHLEECGSCRGACDSLKRTLVLCRDQRDAVVVPAEVQRSVRLAVREFIGASS